MVKDMAVGGTPFPSRQNIDKPEVKVTSCEYVLQQLALAIMIRSSLSLRDMRRYMHPVQSTETPFKLLKGARHFANSMWDRCVLGGEPHKVAVYLFRSEDTKDAINTPIDD